MRGTRGIRGMKGMIKMKGMRGMIRSRKPIRMIKMIKIVISPLLLKSKENLKKSKQNKSLNIWKVMARFGTVKSFKAISLRTKLITA